MHKRNMLNTTLMPLACISDVMLKRSSKCNTRSFLVESGPLSEHSCLITPVFLFPDGCSHSSVSTSLVSTSRPITMSLWKLFWLTRITGAFREESGSLVEKQIIICKVSFRTNDTYFSSGKFVFRVSKYLKNE